MRIFISCKHNDMCDFEVIDDDNTLYESHDYAPYLGIFGGDYTHFQVDNETGKIVGWVPITKEEIERLKEEMK